MYAEDGEGRVIVLSKDSESWESDLVHVPGTGPIVFTRGLGLNPANRPALVFTAGSKVYLAEKGTAGWVIEVVADAHPEGLARQALVICFRSQPLVLYSRTIGSDVSIWAAEKLASGWADYLIFHEYGIQPAAATDRRGAVHVVYRSTDYHGYVYRDPSSGEWVHSVLPAGPYGEAQYYSNIVVGAWDELHVFRSVGSSLPPYGGGVQYLSRGLPLGRDGGPDWPYDRARLRGESEWLRRESLR